MSKERKDPFGRPTDFNEEIANKIIQRVGEHPFGLEKICSMYEDMPAETTVHKWLNRYPDFSQRYYANRENIAHLLFHENINELDRLDKDYYSGEYGQRCIESGVIAAAKLRIAQRNYMAAKLKPSMYNGSGDISQKDESNNIDVSEKAAQIIKESEKEF